MVSVAIAHHWMTSWPYLLGWRFDGLHLPRTQRITNVNRRIVASKPIPGLDGDYHEDMGGYGRALDLTGILTSLNWTEYNGIKAKLAKTGTLECLVQGPTYTNVRMVEVEFTIGTSDIEYRIKFEQTA